MNELTPVAWHTEDHKDDFSATTYDEGLAERWKKKGWPLTPMYYAIPDTHRVVSVETVKDAERYAWLKNHVGEQLTQRSLMNEFSEHKTEYVFPRLIAWADFCGPITLDEAIDFKIAAKTEAQAIIDNKGAT